MQNGVFTRGLLFQIEAVNSLSWCEKDTFLIGLISGWSRHWHLPSSRLVFSRTPRDARIVSPSRHWFTLSRLPADIFYWKKIQFEKLNKVDISWCWPAAEAALSTVHACDTEQLIRFTMAHYLTLSACIVSVGTCFGSKAGVAGIYGLNRACSYSPVLNKFWRTLWFAMKLLTLEWSLVVNTMHHNSPLPSVWFAA